MVEFTLVVILFLTVILGVVEFAHLLLVYTATASAAAEAARYGAATGETEAGVYYYQDCDGIRQAALRVGAVAGLKPEDVVVEYDHGPDTTPFAQCDNPPGLINSGDRLVVTVTIQYRPWVPLFPNVTIPFQARVTRTILGEVQVSPP